MANIIYSIEADTVDPVFFAVVPDSFMTRNGARSPTERPPVDAGEWTEERDLPLLSPHDRWSF